MKHREPSGAQSLNGDDGVGFEVCPCCHGTGRVWDYLTRPGYPRECPHCAGYGRLRAAGQVDAKASDVNCTGMRCQSCSRAETGRGILVCVFDQRPYDGPYRNDKQWWCPDCVFAMLSTGERESDERS